MIVAFAFEYGKIHSFFVCHDTGCHFSKPIPRPDKFSQRDYFYPQYTHVYELTEKELEYIWNNQSEFVLERDNLVSEEMEYNPLSVFDSDWRNGYMVDSDGFINGNYVIFNDEEPPSYVVMSEPPNTLKKPKWTGVEWVEGYVEEVVEPSEIDVLKQEIQTLKQEIENLKA